MFDRKPILTLAKVWGTAGQLPARAPPTFRQFEGATLSTTTSPEIITPKRVQLLRNKQAVMVLQDLGRRINAAVSDLTRAPNLDEKASICSPIATSILT